MGTHEPRSSWTFYYSVATSTLRAVIIVAALVFGGVVLANAFPSGSGDVRPEAPVTTTDSPTTTAPTTTSPAASPATIEGAVLQVLNGTDTSGLAGDVATCLREEGGANIPEDNIGNAPEDFAVTTLVYRPDSQGIAEALREQFFPGAKLQAGEPLPGNPDVRVTVIVGMDYEPVAACA